jgi:hypothetical protein
MLDDAQIPKSGAYILGLVPTLYDKLAVRPEQKYIRCSVSQTTLVHDIARIQPIGLTILIKYFE